MSVKHKKMTVMLTLNVLTLLELMAVCAGLDTLEMGKIAKVNITYTMCDKVQELESRPTLSLGQ